MRKIIFGICLTFFTIFTYGQINYCDSINILITNQSLTSVTCSSSTSGLNTFWSSQDWILTDKYGSTLGLASGSVASFSMPSPMNSDTNYICLTSVLSAPALNIACNTCDTVVWDGSSWMLLSMAPAPCNLTGGGVYIDNNSNPRMMNASVNGMSMYNYFWIDTNGAVISTSNQIPFYTQWCVTIIDNITGCDTTICQDCIPDTNALCMCPMIYMPVCGCDGIMYPNSCVADCADVPWTPAISNGMPGGFLPCSLVNSSCEVEIDGDSIICNWGTPQILTASPTSSSPPFVSYIWDNGQTGPILTVTNPGTYCVTATDSTGCISNECFTVAVQDIPIFSDPSPPNICIGDTVVLEIDTLGLFNIVWIPNSLPTPPVHRIELTPFFSMTCIVEAVDSLGCDRRGEIFIDVYQETPLNPMTVPNPPQVCVGDSVVIEVNQSFVNYWWNTGNPLDQGEDRVVVYPNQDFIYVIEALDSNGCESREEIQVSVDTCATNISMNILNQVEIYPNPTNQDLFIKLPNKQVADIFIYDIEGRLIIRKLNQSSIIKISRDNIKEGVYIIKINNQLGCINKRIIFNK